MFSTESKPILEIMFYWLVLVAFNFSSSTRFALFCIAPNLKGKLTIVKKFPRLNKFQFIFSMFIRFCDFSVNSAIFLPKLDDILSEFREKLQKMIRSIEVSMKLAEFFGNFKFKISEFSGVWIPGIFYSVGMNNSIHS